MKAAPGERQIRVGYKGRSVGTVIQLQADEVLSKRRFIWLNYPFVGTPKGTGAGDEARTRDVLLGKEVLYH